MEFEQDIRTREQAVSRLQALGFYARARDWSFGESVIAATALDVSTDDAHIELLRHPLCIYPSSGRWFVTEMSAAHSPFFESDSLHTAVQQAASWLSRRERTVAIDCDGVENEREFWQAYLEQVRPDGAGFFGRNLDAFHDALKGGPGCPPSTVTTIRFVNVGKVREWNSGAFFEGLEKLAAASAHVRIVLD